MAWLSGYSKRKEITLTGGASGAQTDFQLKLTVSYVAAMDGEFDDLRFTQADGTTLIDAWAEVIVTDTSATVWVEFPTTPANTVEQTYYMYYDHASPVSDWNGTDTFVSFFDGDSTGWTAVDPNGHLAFTNNRLDVAGLARNEDAYVYQALSEDDNIAIEWTYYISAAHATSIPIFAMVGDELDDAANLANGFVTWDYGGSAGRTRIRVNNAGTGADVVSTGVSTQYWMRCIRSGNTVTSYWYSDSARANLIDSSAVTQAGLPALSYVNLVATYNSNESQSWTGWLDDFSVRKYVTNPPTYEFGAEESTSTGNPYWYYNMLKRRN